MKVRPASLVSVPRSQWPRLFARVDTYQAPGVCNYPYPLLSPRKQWLNEGRNYLRAGALRLTFALRVYVGGALARGSFEC